MQNLSHNSLIQKVIGIKNASAWLQSRGKKQIEKRKKGKGQRDFCKTFLEQNLWIQPSCQQRKIKSFWKLPQLSVRFMILFCALKKIVAICLSNKFPSVLPWFKQAVYSQKPQGNVYWKHKIFPEVASQKQNTESKTLKLTITGKCSYSLIHTHRHNCIFI